MRLVQLVSKNIFRRPTRSALTISGVAVAVGAVVALVGIAGSFERSLLAIFQQRGVDLVVVRAGGLQRMNSSLDEKLGSKIRQLPGVRNVSAGLAETMSYADLDLFGVVVRGMPPDSFLLRDLKLIAGRKLAEGDRRVVMLGKVLALNLNKKCGDRFDVVPGEPFQIIGVYESFNIFENGSMIVPLAELQRLMDRQGEVTAFTVVTQQSDKASLDKLRQEIKALAPYLEAMPTREYVDTAVEIRMARAVAWLTSALALIIGTIGMINTMLTAVFERTREISVLRAIGWRKLSVVKLILWESVLLALAGAVVGTVLAIGLTQLLSMIPASGRLVAGDISVDVILKGFAVAIILGVLGGLYPAYRATKLLPTEGLRHE
jgi:putative ABC transport system permease protein